MELTLAANGHERAGAMRQAGAASILRALALQWQRRARAIAIAAVAAGPDHRGPRHQRVAYAEFLARDVTPMLKIFALAVALGLPALALAADLPIVDAHVHYSHDAWSVVPPKEA